MSDKDKKLQLEPLLVEIVESLSPTTLSAIIAGGERRAMTIANILSSVPTDRRVEGSKLFPKLLLREPTIETTMASIAWQTQQILEGNVDTEALEELYKNVSARYKMNAEQEGYEEDNKILGEQMKAISAAFSQILSEGKAEGKVSIFVRLFLARFAREFEHDTEKAEALYREMVASGKTLAISYLGDLLEATGRTEEAEKLYRDAIRRYGDLPSLDNLIALLSKAGRKKEAQESYALYIKPSDGPDNTIPPPYILFTKEVDSDESLEETTFLAQQLIDIQVLSQDAPRIFQSAQRYVDSEMRKQMEFRHATLLGYGRMSAIQGDNIPLPLSERYHDFWIRELFLHMMNACVLFDNSPLRTFEVSEKDGDVVNPGGAETNMKSYLPKMGKAERFIKLMTFLGSNLEGRVILGEFFHRYPVDWIKRHNDLMMILYSRRFDDEDSSDGDDGDDGDDPDQIGEEDSDRDEVQIKDKPPAFPALEGIPLSIPLPEGFLHTGGDFGMRPIQSAEEEISAEEGDDSTRKTQSNREKVFDDIDEILCYMNNMYGSRDDGDLHAAIIELNDGISVESKGETGKNRNLDESIRLFRENINGLPEAYRDTYLSVEEKIRQKYGETIRRSVLYFATYAFTINDSIPDFIREDHLLAWYLVMSHLLGTPAIDEKFIRQILDEPVFRQDNIEDLSYLNSIIISTLIFTAQYGYAADYIAQLPEQINDPTRLVAFFRAISYLEKEDRKQILDELRTGLRQKGFSTSIDKHIARVMEGIDPEDEYADDDRACCMMSQSYWQLIQGHHQAAGRILEPVLSGSLDVIPETLAEARFIAISDEVKKDIKSKNPRHLSELSTIFLTLSYELQTECLILILRLSFVCEIYDFFDETVELAREREFSIGLWEPAAGLVVGDTGEEIAAIRKFSKANLRILPEEVGPVLAKVARKYRDDPSLSDERSTALEASYILAHFTHSGVRNRIEAIREHFAWLSGYLAEFPYTPAGMNDISDIFEGVFGSTIEREDATNPEAITAPERVFHNLSQHFTHFSKIAKSMKEGFEGDDPGAAKMREIFERECSIIVRHSVEILQRIPLPQIEDFIESFRKLAFVSGETESNTEGKEGSTLSSSSFIH